MLLTQKRSMTLKFNRMKHNYKATAIRNIIKNALKVTLSCGLLVQVVPTAAETRLCNENNTWVYQDFEIFPKMMYEMSFSGGKKAPNGKDYSVFKIKRSISNGSDGIKTWGLPMCNPMKNGCSDRTATKYICTTPV